MATLQRPWGSHATLHVLHCGHGGAPPQLRSCRTKAAALAGSAREQAGGEEGRVGGTPAGGGDTPGGGIGPTWWRRRQ
jgi:hypothetical protein